MNSVLAPPERLEQIYVGHLPVDLTDELLKKLLVQCGTILKLTRSRNPKTDELASFCLIELDSVESVWRLTKLFDGLQICGHRLVVKCPQKTQELVDRWQNSRKYLLHKHLVKTASTTAAPVGVGPISPREHNNSIDVSSYYAMNAILHANSASVPPPPPPSIQQPPVVKPPPAPEQPTSTVPEADLEKEFMKAEENVRKGLDVLVKQIEECITKSKVIKEAEDKARAVRIELVKSRIKDRRVLSSEEKNSGNKNRSRQPGGVEGGVLRPQQSKQPADAADVNLPVELLNRQQFRIENYQRKQSDYEKLLADVKQNWEKSVESLKRKAEKREEDYMYRWSNALPSAREAWSQLKADIVGSSAVFTVSYATSNGTSPLYDLEHRLASEASRLSVDVKTDIPMVRYWSHKVQSAREAMRQNERRYHETKRFKKHTPEALADYHKTRIAILEARIAEVDQKAAATKIIAASPDWTKLEQETADLKRWLIERTTDIVGAEDAEDMAEYILDQFPPRAPEPPNEETLMNDMREFLDIETERFVNALWEKIKTY